MIFFEFLQVLGQVVDALGEQRNLDIGRTGVALVQLKILNQLFLRLHNCHAINECLVRI